MVKSNLMKVYFGTSRRIKKIYKDEVEEIYRLIKEYGFEHTSNFVIQATSKKIGQLHREAIEGIKKADICVFEASRHSLSVGYLINYSLNLNKPVVVLSQSRTVSEIFEQLNLPRLIFVFYQELGELRRRLRKILRKAASQVDIRFNFFITPLLLNYLDWVAEEKRIPKSVYLRELIEKDMRRNREYRKKSKEGVG